ncbi:MAG TPA: Uma2 family endonuclease [Blastocatellia bacterium]|nr:Uma2 family endonuclease [Blastocatellia bacterium]
MSSLAQHYLTPEEYLATERKSEYKSEYADGVMYAMAGGSERHNLIVANTIISIGSQLRDRPWQVYPSDLKVRVPNSSKFFYPDVSVVCGEVKYADEHKDVILNPTFIAEILSDSTAAFDRGKKFLAYQQIISLNEFVFVAQDEILVEKYARQGADNWLYTKVTDLKSVVKLPSIGCDLILKEIYDKTE